MSNPGVPGGNLPAREDHIMRRLANIERDIRELRAADLAAADVDPAVAALVSNPMSATAIAVLAGVSTATSPSAPTVVTAAAGNSQATITFALGSEGGSAITSSTITSSPGGLTTVVSGVGTIGTVTGLTNGTAYTFTVRSTNSLGVSLVSAASSAVTPVAVAVAPSAPTGVTALAGDTTATVTFTLGSNGGSVITGSTITSSPGGFTGAVPGTGNSGTVAGLTDGIAYTFAVTSTNVVGTSPASVTSSPVTPAAPLGTSMLSASIYGQGLAADTKSNVRINPAGDGKAAIRFMAETTSALNSVQWVQRGGGRSISGYSVGNGGTTTITIQTDNGSGLPSGIILATTTWTCTNGNPSTNWETYDTSVFASPPILTAGNIYYVVFANASTTNSVSINSTTCYIPAPGAGGSPRQYQFADLQFGLLYDTGPWGAGSMPFALLPVFDLTYANGTHSGQCYYEAGISFYGTVSGVKQACEHFTVTGTPRTISRVSVRLRRTSGTDPLTITLMTAAGVVIDSGTLAATSIGIGAPGGDTGTGLTWANATFGSSHTLTVGTSYRVVLSCPGTTIYTAFPLRPGVPAAGGTQSFGSFYFADGSGSWATGAGGFEISADSGGTWALAYAYAPMDMQFYLS